MDFFVPPFTAFAVWGVEGVPPGFSPIEIPPSEVNQDELWAFVNEQPGMEAAPEMEPEAAGAEKSSGSSFIKGPLDWTSPPRERVVADVFSLGGEHDAQASSSHMMADDQEERAVLKAEIEHSVEKALRAYCNRPSVAKRFPIHSPTLDFSSLAKHLVHEELDVDLASIEELRGLQGHVQSIQRIKGIFDELLESLNEKKE